MKTFIQYKEHLGNKFDIRLFIKYQMSFYFIVSAWLTLMQVIWIMDVGNMNSGCGCGLCVVVEFWWMLLAMKFLELLLSMIMWYWRLVILFFFFFGLLWILSFMVKFKKWSAFMNCCWDFHYFVWIKDFIFIHIVTLCL